MSKILLVHLQGSKAGQVDTFEIPIKAIVLGRDPTADVVFDRLGDSLVSRTHCSIAQEGDAQFLVTDLNSRNGTFVNGTRISGTLTIKPGDTLQLGRDGAKLLFDVQPPLAGVLPETRVESKGGGGPSLHMQSLSQPEARPSQDAVLRAAPKEGEHGANMTTEWIVGQIVGAIRRNRIGGAILAILASIAGYTGQSGDKGQVQAIIKSVTDYFAYQNDRARAKPKTDGRLDAGGNPPVEAPLRSSEAPALPGSAESRSAGDSPMSAAAIAAAYAGATVQIESSWSLLQRGSGQRLYQKVSCAKYNRGKTCVQRLPWYVLYHDSVEPLLDVSSGDRDGDYLPIGSPGQMHTGSGFVVSESGFILTHSRLAAAWESAGYENLGLPGFLKICGDEACSDAKARTTTFGTGAEDAAYVTSLKQWVPARSRFVGGQPVKARAVEGHNEYLEVTFPNSKVRIAARLVRVSDGAEVALLKIELPQAAKSVKLDPKSSGQAGDTVTVLGFAAPVGLTPSGSDDPLDREERWRVIPEPTVMVGNIGSMLKGDPSNPAAGSDRYQLGLYGSAVGYDGAPVFNDKGVVIGLMSSGSMDKQAAGVTWAVPIRYGLEIMGVQ